jgi:hypothetical protein
MYTGDNCDSALFVACITESFIYSLLYPSQDEGRVPWDFKEAYKDHNESRDLLKALFRAFKAKNERSRSGFPVLIYPAKEMIEELRKRGKV